MTAHHSSVHLRRRHIATIHAAAISVAFVSGTVALVALLVGTPLEYGSALALCAAAWIVAHIAERFAEQRRASRRRTAPAKRRTDAPYFAPGYVRLGTVVRQQRPATRERVLTPV